MEHLSSAITQAYEVACPARIRNSSKRFPWWNKKLDQARKDTRKLLNKATKANTQPAWDNYKMSQQAYKKLIRTSKRTGWKIFCKETELPAWRYSKVVFIPKPGKDNYDLAKSYRPISLTSFLLKTLERLVDRYIRDEVLASKPLHPSQHAYQNGKSTATALHNLVGSIEGALSNGESALCIFLDIEGAFGNTPHDAIQEAAIRYNIKDSVVRWIHNMLTNRTVTASLGEETVRADVARGCPSPIPPAVDLRG
nr:uncharacterized protein LOC117602918 [Osmia lignaria]